MDPENTQTIPVQPTPVPVQSIQSVQPISPTKKSKLPLILGILVLLGVVGVAVILGGKYLFGQKTETVQPVVMVTTTTPTPMADPTSDWKIYTNEVYKFTIKYPKEWREEVRGDKLILLTPESINLKNSQIEGIFINIVTNLKNLSSQEYLNQVAIPAQKDSPCEGKIRIVSDIYKTLEGLDVTLAEGFCGVLNQGPQMFISKGDNIIVLSSSLNNLDRNLVNQIYATFKFLEQIEPTSTLTPEDLSCGGFSPFPTRTCPSGYICKLPEALDAPGKCIKE